MIVDSQTHVSPQWYEPVETLLRQMDAHGIAQAVLIQMLGQFDNDYQQSCLARYPGRFASVVLVDPGRQDACQHLRGLADAGAGGVRLRPGARSPGDDPLAIWRAAEACGLPVSCVGNSPAFTDPAFADLLSALPRLKVVLEHLGGTSKADTDQTETEARQRVFALARFPEVYLKVPGMGELVPRSSKLVADTIPFDPTVPPILLAALESFGPRRLMWGSDFPPVSSREGYGNSLRFVQQALSSQAAGDLDRIFGGTAHEVFALSR